MKNNIIDQSIDRIITSQTGRTKTEGKKSDISFGSLLKKQIQDVNKLQQEADKAATDLAVGEKKNIHETMIALEKADISFKLMMKVRDKIVQAYEEIMKMSV
jgi:flagellar hook-basal body complex protein FliE